MHRPVFKLGIDIDGTINDMNHYLNMHVTQWLNRLGIKRDPDQSKYFISERFSINESVSDKLMSSMDYGSVPILDEFIDSCHHLNHDTIAVYYITHRDPLLPQIFVNSLTDTLNHQTLETLTKRQLSRLPLVYKQIIHTNDKAKVCKELGIDLMIEDSPHELDNLIEHSVPTMKIAYPYNMHINLPVIEDWEIFLSNFRNSEIYLKKIKEEHYEKNSIY